MKSKLLQLIMATVMLGALTIQAMAAEYVYVTKRGKRYHHAESRFIKGKDVERITKKEAEERGLRPVTGYEAAPEDIDDKE